MLAFAIAFMMGVAMATPDLIECDQFYLVTNSTDRCQTTDCLCRVKPGPKPQNPVKVVDVERRYSVYFPNAVHEMKSNQATAMKKYLTTLRKFFPNGKMSIIAYTDGCGSMEYNTALARRRLATAIQEINDLFPVSHTFIHPEASQECPLPAARRIDAIVHTERRLTTVIDKIPADVYLIDASGSMWGEWRQWTDVINASYKPGARIYVSMTAGCRTGQVLDNVRPQGGTEIWYSYWRVLDFMKPGETLAIISDFQSDIPLTQAEHSLITTKVREKGIHVIVVRP